MKITTAPFDALYELPPAVPSSPSTLAIVTMLPRSSSTGLFEHARDRVLAHEERAGEVDVEHALPLVAVEEVRGPTARDARGGDHRVEPAVLGDRGADRVGDRVLVAHVGLYERDLGRPRERRARRGLGEVEADDPRALVARSARRTPARCPTPRPSRARPSRPAFHGNSSSTSPFTGRSRSVEPTRRATTGRRSIADRAKHRWRRNKPRPQPRDGADARHRSGRARRRPLDGPRRQERGRRRRGRGHARRAQHASRWTASS